MSDGHAMDYVHCPLPRIHEAATSDLAEIEIQKMVHIGNGQYLCADDASLVKGEGATLTGQQS